MTLTAVSAHRTTLADIRESWNDELTYIDWAENIAEYLPGVTEGYISDEGGHGRIEGELVSIHIHQMTLEYNMGNLENWYYAFEAAAYEAAVEQIRRALPDLTITDSDLISELVERVTDL